MTLQKCFGALLTLTLLGNVAVAEPVNLPAATQLYLKQLKVPPSFLSDIDRELTIPQEWVAGAKKEEAAIITSTWTAEQFKHLSAAFHVRYPYAKIEYQIGSRYDRAIKPLIAFKEGHYVADIITSFTRTLHQLKQLKALANLKSLPNFHAIAPGMADPEGEWAGERIAYWCLGYNTDVVNKPNLPKTWGDLATNKFWWNGQLALSNSADGWVPALWASKGPTWTKNFLTTLFTRVHPQLRKEGRNASLRLAVGGEFGGVIPAGAYKVREFADKGAPIGFHCPEIVPASVSEMAIMNGTPHIDNARIFLNWYLSKEGQIALMATTGMLPVRKDMQKKDFVSYPEEIFGKDHKIVIQDIDAQTKILPQIKEIWQKGWQGELKVTK